MLDCEQLLEAVSLQPNGLQAASHGSCCNRTLPPLLTSLDDAVHLVQQRGLTRFVYACFSNCV
jgi:hypothetical protein